MKIQTFEEIISWQKSQILAETVYELFKNSRDFWFRDQIQRAVVSISNNIAEWFERKSNNEFVYFLFVAKGSCGEFRSMLYLAKNIWYLPEESFRELYNASLEVSKLLSALITSIKKSEQLFPK